MPSPERVPHLFDSVSFLPARSEGLAHPGSPVSHPGSSRPGGVQLRQRGALSSRALLVCFCPWPDQWPLGAARPYNTRDFNKTTDVRNRGAQSHRYIVPRSSPWKQDARASLTGSCLVLHSIVARTPVLSFFSLVSSHLYPSIPPPRAFPHALGT